MIEFLIQVLLKSPLLLLVQIDYLFQQQMFQMCSLDLIQNLKFVPFNGVVELNFSSTISFFNFIIILHFCVLHS